MHFREVTGLIGVSPLSSSRLLQPQVWHPLVGQLLRPQADYFRMSSSVSPSGRVEGIHIEDK